MVATRMARAGKKTRVATVGERVEEKRLDADLTRLQLALKVGVDPSTIYRIEKGTVAVTLDRLGQIADALGTTVAELVES